MERFTEVNDVLLNDRFITTHYVHAQSDIYGMTSPGEITQKRKIKTTLIEGRRRPTVDYSRGEKIRAVYTVR